MNQDLTQHERMVDQYGRRLTWRGKWVHYDPPIMWDQSRPMLPAMYPVKYYHTERG